MLSIQPSVPTTVPQNSPLAVTVSLSLQNAVTLFPRDTAMCCLLRSRPYASSVFDEIPDRDAHDWAACIRRLARDGRPREALTVFRKMVFDYRLEPDDLSIPTVLGCCASLGAVRRGREVHGFMVRNTGERGLGCSSESSLVGFYAKCSLVSKAREVFDRMAHRDVVSWTIMLKAYADREGQEREMMALFVEMLHSSVAPNRHTLTVGLHRVAPEIGKQLHAYIVKRSWDSDAFIGCSLVDMYAKNDVLGSAQLVFDGIKHKDVVCYNSLISCYGRSGFVEHLYSLFLEMVSAGLVPSQSTFVGLLGGCANSGFIGPSRQFHAQVVVRGLGSDEVIQAVIVDMYAKCGVLEAAHAAFAGISVKRSVVAWNSMIGGYGKHGLTEEAIQLLNLMESASVRPDHITFICLLSACSHSGLVEEGWRLFNLMRDEYRIPAQNEHYCCMVDLLGRAGMLRDAYEFIRTFKCEYRPSVWGALLSACRVWGDAEIGAIAARRLFELEPECSGSYVALANIYAAIGQWDDAVAVRELMDGQRIKKDPGCSWIEIGGEVHRFRAMEGMGDHNCMEELYLMCDRLNSFVRDYFHFEKLLDCGVSYKNEV